MSRRGFAVLALALATACDDDLYSPPVCTTEAVAGITVDLLDQSGTPLSAEDAEGRAADPEQPHLYVLESFGERLVGVWEAPGTYLVTVEKPGYVTWVRDGVRVEEGTCHVVPVRLEATLVPPP